MLPHLLPHTGSPAVCHPHAVLLCPSSFDRRLSRKSLSFNSLSLTVYVRMCLQMCAHAHVYRPDVRAECLPQSLFTLFFEVMQGAWLASEHQGPSCLSARVMGCTRLCLTFAVASGTLNSDACVAIPFLTKPSPPHHGSEMCMPLCKLSQFLFLNLNHDHVFLYREGLPQQV